MDVNEELPTCPVCQEEFDDQKAPFIISCGHSLCETCIVHLKSDYSDAYGSGGQTQCPTCRAVVSKEKRTKNFALTNAVTMIQKLREKPKKPANAVDCTQCTKYDNESDMFVCRNCVTDAFKYDVVENLGAEVDLDIKSLALCGSCALRSHVTQGHETVAYFPVASGMNFASQLTSISLLRIELESSFGLTNAWYARFASTYKTFHTELDKMTDMMRKSKSSDVQEEFSKRIDQEIKRMSDYVQSVCLEIANKDKEYQKSFTALVAINKKDEETKCQEPVEKIFELTCSECMTKQTVERFRCCKTCIEVVGKLVDNLLETTEIDAVDLETLPICTNCIVDHHHSDGEHKTVRYSQVQEAYTSLKVFSKVEKHKDEINIKFSALLDTFKHYITQLEGYDDKITKMSKIAMESRGHPEQAEVVKGFQNELEKADHAISSLQSNADMSQTVVRMQQKRLDAVENEFGTTSDA
ncbi:RING-type domain-containing protein [Caenorhabditis elegans]|uniref:RING-type domain-containing protein n=1 Tax=Caenorhabditis elegans TaxID=6239 RepID=Q9N3T6_CAEEL|nr:RING-type domain-containing protein [Caenorhabditis elegans]CCD72559.1 RING-type domain-containing protein [Caenorhabditis elegans]|eukprot:NP_491164.2 Uncharacterized protein CELE_Y47G6A.14 [Caenorhabditis elegans]